MIFVLSTIAIVMLAKKLNFENCLGKEELGNED